MALGANRILCNGAITAMSLLISLCIGGSLCKAQLMTTGAINGTVADNSGAIITGADVTITNLGTGTSSHTVSNDVGSFSQVGLAVGNYEVTVTKAGFSSFHETGIYVGPTIVMRVNATLGPSAVVTTVTVQASSAQVQTSTNELSTQVSEEQVGMLPLNGRNYQGLAALMPGVLNLSAGTGLGTGGFNTSNTMSINGEGNSGSLYTLDGIWNENTGNMTQTSITPNPDEIQQVEVLASNYSVKYNLMGANSVIVQTKSGTGTLHGGAWEYNRLTAEDARNYFSTTVSPVEWNIYGYDLGGPVFIPHHYNSSKERTFFYINQQWVRQKAGGVQTGATPTALMRSGIFPTTGPYAVTIKDPTTGIPFQNNQIPSGEINSGNLTLLNALAPLPNSQGTAFNNYTNANPTVTSQLDTMAKVDENITSKIHLMGEIFHLGQLTDNPAALRQGSPFANNFDTFATHNSLAQLQLTQIITATMTNQASVAMNRYIVDHFYGGIILASQVPGFSVAGFPYPPIAFPGSPNWLPQITFSGGWSQFGTRSLNVIPRATDLEDSFTDNWGWLRGKHFIEAGATFLLGTKRQYAGGPYPTTGSFSFNGSRSGSPIADYLLGYAATFTQDNTEFRRFLHYPIYSPYFEDQWTVLSRLTITAGVRYLYMPWSTMQTNFADPFNPALFNPKNAPCVAANGVITTASCTNNYGNAVTAATYSNANGLYFPGVNGVPNNLTNAHRNYWAPSVGFAWDVFGNGQTALRGGYSINYDKSASSNDCSLTCVDPPLPGLAAVSLINVNFPSPTGGTAAPLTAFNFGGEDLQKLQAGKVQTFSLSLQQQFKSNWFVSVAGAGNIGRPLPLQININQPPPVTISGVQYDFNPNLNITGAGAYTSAYYAPYQGYGSIGYNTSFGRAYWDALEFNLRHPVGQNLFLTIAYTWSHNLADTPTIGPGDENGGLQNAYNPMGDYGNTNLNTPHVFNVSIVYSLPRLQSASALKRNLLGGWRYSDITTVQSGTSLTPGLASLGAYGTGPATRPNVVGDHTSGICPNGHSVKTQQCWFNTSAFAEPLPGYFGKAGVGTILGPGLINFDMAAYKEFQIHERMSLEFRSEFFNIFNHTNFRAVTTTFNNGGNGTVTSAADPHMGELSLRINF